MKLAPRDYKTICELFKAKESVLRNAALSFIKKYYPKDKIIATKDYIYAYGDIPVGLVAHLDTVHRTPPFEIFHDERKGVIWSPEGIGADDRAGVYAIFSIIREGYKPTVILCTQEEVGGIGADKLVQDIPSPKSPINFLIELDRSGFNDMVFYNCNNEEFENYIKGFGFNTHYGSFSDIVMIAPKWGVAAVNLSIGYEDEHTKHERLYYHYMFKTIDKVRKILEAEVVDSHPFSFIPKFLYGADISMKIDEEFLCLDPSMVACDCCGVYTKRSEIKNIYDDGLDWHLCKKCTDTFSRVCKKCGNYFLPWHEESAEVFCPTCSIERWSEKEEGLNA